MAKLKARDIIKMSKEEISKKMEELKMELVKARVAASKTGNSKVREIKRLIARLLTIEKNKK
ncbi:MAG: 50S ribosomal protein L29 [Candidatus Pacearchaeota archaeon]|nr:50S ribosomal protein L29 [Nanoarchaeota archaeon]MDZ4226515.1 50S ribosomal protein L29 [Candidatus Pacearchaeota archaeon]